MKQEEHERKDSETREETRETRKHKGTQTMLSIIQIVIVIFAVFALSRAVLRWRDRTMNLFEFLFWAVVWTGLLILVFIPDITTIISRLWGVGRGIDSILYLSIIALFYLVFRLYARLDPRRQEITRLVRHIAIENAKRPLFGAAKVDADSVRKK